MKTIILDTTNKSLIAVLGEAHTTTGVRFTTHYGIVSGTSMTESNVQIVSNGLTEVTIVDVPASTTRRIIRNVTVYNEDTVTHSVVIRMKDTATYYTVVTLSLVAGASWSSGDILVLDATDESVRAYLGEAITIQEVNFETHYADVTGSTLTEGNALVLSSGVTNVEILASPAASTRRVVKDLVIYNRDTVSHTVYIAIRNNVTDYTLKKLTIASTDNWSLSQNEYELDHKNLRSIGTNSHATIDSFIASKASASGLASLSAGSLVVQDPANATATPTASKIVIANGSGKVDGWVTAATTSASGISELATSGEVTTGTSSALSIPPASLAKSDVYGVKAGSFRVVAEATDVDTATGIFYFWIPQALNGLSLYRANAMVDTAGTTNPTTIQVRNLTKYGSNDALSTAISIASAGTIGTAGTVATSYDDVSTNDKIKIYVTAQSTTKPKGLTVVLEYQLY